MRERLPGLRRDEISTAPSIHPVPVRGSSVNIFTGTAGVPPATSALARVKLFIEPILVRNGLRAGRPWSQ
jgi:hypothetical protein